MTREQINQRLLKAGWEQSQGVPGHPELPRMWRKDGGPWKHMANAVEEVGLAKEFAASLGRPTPQGCNATPR